MIATAAQTLTSTRMRREIEEIPDTVERLLSEGMPAVEEAAKMAREKQPRFMLSVARGSSDHACTFLKYASELILKRPMASIGPSVKSIYDVDLACEDALAIAISQSGMSPDIVRLSASLADGGCPVVALTNTENSDLAAAASHVLPLHAGPETSVAATKTFVASLVAGLMLFAKMERDEALLPALHALPQFLEEAINCDWSEVTENISGQSLFTIGRGPSFAIASEAALKLKETCRLHGEAYSSAEVLHGPISIAGDGFPIIGFAAGDKAEDSVAKSLDALAATGAKVFATTRKVQTASYLPNVRTNHWLTDPISLIVSFYNMVEKLALKRGFNPDMPRHLKKVTETV